MERTSCCQSRRPTEPAGESLCLPSPTCLQDGGALQSTGEHSRAQRIDNKATNFQRVTTKVARHQPVSVLRRRGFDSRRLHRCSNIAYHIDFQLVVGAPAVDQFLFTQRSSRTTKVSFTRG